MAFLEETADLSQLSRSGPNGDRRDMTRGNRDVTNRFTGYYSNIDYKVKFGIPEPLSPGILYLDSKNDYPPLFDQKNVFSVKFKGVSRLENIGKDGFFDTYYSLHYFFELKKKSQLKILLIKLQIFFMMIVNI